MLHYITIVEILKRVSCFKNIYYTVQHEWEKRSSWMIRRRRRKKMASVLRDASLGFILQTNAFSFYHRERCLQMREIS